MAAAAFSNFMGSVYVVTKKSAASFWTSLAGVAIATFASCLVVFLIRLVNARCLLPFPLSGKKLCLGISVLLIQTTVLLLHWPGWLLVQAASPLLLLLLGLPALLSTLQMILHRK